MIPLSVLDLVPVSEGATIAEALAAAAQLAQCAEAQGYARFWVAEHHGMKGIGGAATSVVLAHIGHATSTIRFGAGGIMLPNHNPFIIAEQFATLDALFPGRVDLGLGRAPGSYGGIAKAMRKDIARAAEFFPQDVAELRAYFTGDAALPVEPTPARGAHLEMWMLGSSLYGAQVAAALGLPYAFASHFAPDLLDDALRIYREKFRPSAALDQPHVMAAMTVFTAETDGEARLLASSQEQMFIAIRRGQTERVQPPVADYKAGLAMGEQAMLDHVGQAYAIGSPVTVRETIGRFVERTQADEIIVSGVTFDAEARRHSVRLTMEAMKG